MDESSEEGTESPHNPCSTGASAKAKWSAYLGAEPSTVVGAERFFALTLSAALELVHALCEARQAYVLHERAARYRGQREAKME